MAEDPTMVVTMVNMMANGCRMHADVFTTMGKGAPEFTMAGNQLQIALSDGVYTATIVFDPVLTAARELANEQGTDL
jgi:hypothetical protein